MTQIISSFSGEFDFLSNFYPASVYYDGDMYKTTEAAFQAAKTSDRAQRMAIADARTPGEAKHLGRRVTLRVDWEEHKDQVMLELLRQKFAPGTPLADKLEMTGDAILVEGTTWHDQYWGVCKCEKHQGIGRNVLGQLLMIVRAENRIPSVSHTMSSGWLFGQTT